MYSAPSAAFESVADGFATGLTGTIGVRLRDNQGNDAIARTTAGIAEDIAGSGIYRVTLTAPAAAGAYTIVWDDASGHFAVDDLTVTADGQPNSSPPSSPATYVALGGYFGATELTLVLPAGVSIGTNTTPIALGEVATMIAEVSADLDVTIAGRGYTVPIDTTATIAYAAVQMAAKQGVGARILQTLFPNMGGPGGKTTQADQYAAAYKAFKDGITKGTIALVGASEAASGGRVLPRSRSTSGEPTGMSASPFVPIDWAP